MTVFKNNSYEKNGAFTYFNFRTLKLPPLIFQYKNKKDVFFPVFSP